MSKHKTQEASDRVATLHSLPSDTLRKIIRELGFRDKCCLELVGQEFHDILGSPSPTEGLWGTCDLLSDLRVRQRFDSTGDIMRWLNRRLLGITDLVCNATSANQSFEPHLCDTKSAASWLVAQLPKLCSASTSTFELHLTLDSDLAAKLLRLNPTYRSIQDQFWDALSDRMTELCVVMDPNPLKPMRLDVLSQLTKLTSLSMGKGNKYPMFYEIAASYTISLPGLKSLHMRNTTFSNLKFLSPGLRSLTLESPIIKGHLFLPPSLEELSVRGISAIPLQVDEASAVSTLLGLTSLSCHVPGGLRRDLLYSVLPSMSALRSLDLIALDGQLPPLLPGSLHTINFLETIYHPLSARDLQHFASACRLPELQSISLYNSGKWQPDVLQALEKITAKSSVKISMEENWKDNAHIFPGSMLV